MFADHLHDLAQVGRRSSDVFAGAGEADSSTPANPSKNITNVRKAARRMYGPEAGSMATASGLSSATAQTQLGVNTVGSSPDDLVSLHESIARLLAVQGNWKRAYSHLHAALRLAREAERSAPAIPEQFRMQVAELHRAHAAAVHASLRDSLTAAYNRRYLDQRLAELLAENTADPRSPGIAVALVDLDLFKSVNDAHGHLVGDQVLRQVVRLMQAELPSTGFCARYGGEEFVLVLPDMSAAAAVGIVERVRRRVAARTEPACDAQRRADARGGRRVPHGHRAVPRAGRRGSLRRQPGRPQRGELPGCQHDQVRRYGRQRALSVSSHRDHWHQCLPP